MRGRSHRHRSRRIGSWAGVFRWVTLGAAMMLSPAPGSVVPTMTSARAQAQPKATPPPTDDGGASERASTPRARVASRVALPEAKRSRLDNGLRVVVLADHRSPTVSIAVVYDVGTRNEVRGKSGLARIVERMMFEGSRAVARGEHAGLVTSRGGHAHAFTGKDATVYENVLPASELALGLWLEADRMRGLDMTPRGFENARAHEGALADRPSAIGAVTSAARVRLEELAFSGYFPYQHPSSGAPRDLDRATLASVRAFYDAHYAPNNAVVSIVGDVDEKEAFGLVARYFAPLPLEPAIPPLPRARPPEQTTPRDAIVEDREGASAALLSGWVIPPSDDAEHDALVAAATILGDGESSRLHHLLVRERGLARRATASTLNHRGPDLFTVIIELGADGRDGRVGHVEQAKKLLESALAELARSGPSDDEMKKLEARTVTRFASSFQSNDARARALAEAELRRGDANQLEAELARSLRVTREDIKRVAAKYLTPVRRNGVEVKPGAKK